MHVIELNLGDLIGGESIDARARRHTGKGMKEIMGLPKAEKEALLKKLFSRVLIDPQARLTMIVSVATAIYELMTMTDPDMIRKALSVERAADLETEHKYREAGLNPAVELTGIQDEKKAEEKYAKSMKGYRKMYSIIEAFMLVRSQLADAIRELGLPADIEDCFKEGKCASGESQSRS